MVIYSIIWKHGIAKLNKFNLESVFNYYANLFKFFRPFGEIQLFYDYSEMPDSANNYSDSSELQMMIFTMPLIKVSSKSYTLKNILNILKKME